MFDTARKKFILSLLLSGTFGAILFFAVYYRMFPISDISWIVADGWDTFQHQIGWELYRRAPWVFPMIGQNLFYGYPVGVPIIYTDSLPLFAIPLKLFSAWLPQQFQYFGIWTLLCFVLQGMFGFLLLKSVTKRLDASVIGSIFFVLSPIMHQRIGGHSALTAHWLILWALWLTLREHQRFAYKEWTFLWVLSLLIHPYILFTVAFVFLAELLSLFFVKKTLAIKHALSYILFLGCVLGIVSYMIGLFYVGDAGANGFGIFSMNINAIINPGAWRSPIMPEWRTLQYQFEGFNYLGAGVIAMLIGSLYFFIKKHAYRDLWQKHWPLICVSGVLTLLALSHIVALGSHVLVHIPLPHKIEKLLSVIRSSGRMFWPVNYLLVVCSFYWLRHTKKNVGIVLLLIALAVQCYDFYPILKFTKHRYDALEQTVFLKAPFWDLIKDDYRHIAYVPNYTVDYTYAPMVLYGAYNNMTVNSGYYARAIKGNNQHLKDMQRRLEAGEIDPDTLYVLTGDTSKYATIIDQQTHLLTTVDGYTIIAPNFFVRHPKQ